MVLTYSGPFPRPRSGRAVAYDHLFRHPERSRPAGGVVEGPPLVAEATEQVPRLRLAEPAPSEVEGLGSGREDGVFGHMRKTCPKLEEGLKRMEAVTARRAVCE